MRIVIATRAATLFDWLDGPLVWLDAHRHTISVEGRTQRLAPGPWTVAAGIIARAPYVVTRAEIIEGVWGDDPEGGPLTIHKVIDIYVFRARRAIAPLGIKVATRHGFGWSAWFADQAMMQRAA